MIIKFILYLLMIIGKDCLSSPVWERLRKHKTIAFQSSLSSPIEFNINEGSKFHLTCSFLSNFDKIDVFWFHNGTLLQSFISKTISKKEDDTVENSLIFVTIISTIEIKKTHFDMNGLYQCIGIHLKTYSQQNFRIHVIANETNSIKTNFSKDALITLHTYQSLFEPRNRTTLMCRVGDNRKDKCKIQWFDREHKPLNTRQDKTDLVLKNANFNDNKGFYICQICCQKECQTLTSFVYPAGSDN